MNRGSCICEDIQWQLDGEPDMVINCHCSMCRKAHGSAYATFAMAAADKLHFTSGADKGAVFAASDHGQRHHCPRCGSVLPVTANGMAFVPLGSLEDAVERPLDAHIFVKSKAPWFEITDDAHQFDEYPPDYAMPPTDVGERSAETEGAVSGSCLCGRVRYEFDPPAQRMVNCHCQRCRRSRSAVFSTQVFVAGEQFRWLSGEDETTVYKVPDAKVFAPRFCRHCGSLMPRVAEDGSIAAIPAGALDQDPGLRPAAHIFVGSGCPSHRITDELPQHDGYPPA